MPPQAGKCYTAEPDHLLFCSGAPALHVPLYSYNNYYIVMMPVFGICWQCLLLYQYFINIVMPLFTGMPMLVVAIYITSTILVVHASLAIEMHQEQN